jgi:DNA-binding LacI/PurR family transcriptional regulator
MSIVSIKQGEVIRSLTKHWMDHGSQEGHRLPGERVIARQLGVSRITVKTAMDKLERIGVVDRRGRSGTYLAKRPTTDLIAMLGQSASHGRGRGRRSATAPSARVVTRPTYRLGLMHCLKPGDQSAGDVISGVSGYLEQRGHSLAIGPSRPAVGVVAEFSDQVYRPNVDGMILWATMRETDLPNLARIPVPYVVLGDGAMLLNQNQVMLDATLGCQHALDHFLRHGRRRIAVLEANFSITSTMRLRGQCVALADSAAGVEVRHYFSVDPMSDLLAGDQKPDAIYVSDDVYCSQTCGRLRDAGLTIGEGLEVISMAKLHHQNMLPPSVGRMAFDVAELGRQAAMMLERLLDERLDALPMLRIGPMYVPPVSL